MYSHKLYISTEDQHTVHVIECAYACTCMHGVSILGELGISHLIILHAGNSLYQPSSCSLNFVMSAA